MRQAAFLLAGLLLAGCLTPVREPPLDSGVDGGALDAGDADAGRLDAGAPDGGRADGGAFDAGVVDAGAPDSGVSDGGANGLVVRGRSLLGPGSSWIASAVAVGSDLYIVGSFSGAVDFGAGAVLASQGSQSNGFIAKYDTALALQWVLPFAGPKNYVTGVSYDLSAADLVIVGQFETSIGLGGSALAAAGSRDGYVARVSTTGVVTSWVHLRPTDGGFVRGNGIAAAPGKLAVVGEFFRPFSTDGGREAPPNVAQAAAESAFVAFYDSSLAPTGSTWAAQGFLPYTGCKAVEVVADAVGDFYVLGDAISQCVVAGATLGLDPGGYGGTRFVWKVRSDTSSAWAESYGQKIGYGDQETLLVDGPSLFLAGSTERTLQPTLMTSDGGAIARQDGGPLFGGWGARI